LATLALLTPYLQGLMGYPVVTAGLVMGPRGFGTMGAMMGVGRPDNTGATRPPVAFRLRLPGCSLFQLTGWTPDIGEGRIMLTGFFQGAGLALLFVPLSTITFATLRPDQRTEATALYNLSRNIGSSIGISVVASLLVENTQANHAEIAEHVT